MEWYYIALIVALHAYMWIFYWKYFSKEKPSVMQEKKTIKANPKTSSP